VEARALGFQGACIVSAAATGKTYPSQPLIIHHAKNPVVCAACSLSHGSGSVKELSGGRLAARSGCETKRGLSTQKARRQKVPWPLKRPAI